MVDRSLILEELQARVVELERLLQVRSSELRELQRLLDHRDLLILTRLSLGRPALEGLAYTPGVWEERTTLRRLDVGPTLTDLWLARPAAPTPEVPTPAVDYPLPSGSRELRAGPLGQLNETTTLESAGVAEALGTVWRERRESE